MITKRMQGGWLLVLGAALDLLGGVASAQAPGVTATPLMRTTLSGDAQREAVIATVVFAPGASTGRHSHAGDEYATVLEGSLELHADGQPTHQVKAGEAYHNLRGVIHETRNTGSVPARVASTFIIDKNAPLIIPAPKQ